jgi:predicted nucleotidyltransferase
VILFGSHADGTAGADSDIDLLVVTQDDFFLGLLGKKQNFI